MIDITVWFRMTKWWLACTLTLLATCAEPDGITHVTLGRTFKGVTDLALIDGQLHFIVDGKLVYFLHTAGKATLIDSLPRAAFLTPEDPFVRSRDRLYRIGRDGDRQATLLPAAINADSLLLARKIGATLTDYEVVDCCRGEWGGTLSFVSKSDTSQVYSLESTCFLKLLAGPEHLIILNYLGHNFGSSSIYRIGDIQQLPLAPLCTEFGYRLDTLAFADITMQSIATASPAAANSQLLDTSAVRIVDGQIIGDTLYVLFEALWPQRMWVSRFSENGFSRVHDFTFSGREKALSMNGFMTGEGKVFVHLYAWIYDELKSGKGYENRIMIYDILSDRWEHVEIDR